MTSLQRGLVLPVLVLVASVTAASAFGSAIIGRDVSQPTLSVDRQGNAYVGYRVGGRTVKLQASGAINARTPNRNVPQVKFQLRYGVGGKGTCLPYDGPPLAWLVKVCKAPDGSYWAIQAWQRLLPMRGFAPWLPQQGAYEFHLSHWSGPIADFQVSQNWTYGGEWQGVFGRLTYAGNPVYGFTTPSATRRDPYARLVYIDAHDSVYGTGWRHDTAVALHVGDGAFCYSFVPQAPPAGYPDARLRGPAIGDQHRVTVMGPGVTPDVQWVGPSLGKYDPIRDRAFNELFDELVGPNDKVCSAER